MKEEKHTFMICAYGESPYLEACIQSCIEQESVKRGTSVISLYTSTPNATVQDLCKQYNLSFFTKTGGGIGKDWNNSLSFVETPYATIVHQDDIYLPHYGTVIIEAFDQQKDSTIAFTDYAEINKLGEVRKRNINLHIKTFGLSVMSLLPFKGYQRRIYAFGNFISCPAVSYNLTNLTGFKFDETLKMTLDWDAWERIMKRAGKIKYIREKLMYHRIHEESETTNNTVDKTREQEEQLLYERYWGKRFSKVLMKFYTFNQKSNDT